jgi:hypothetical protein
LLKQSGLFSDSLYPLLQNRITIPLRDERGRIVAFAGRALVNWQKSAGEGGVIAKIGGVKLQKSAGIFAIMSATLSGFGKKFWNALGKSL